MAKSMKKMLLLAKKEVTEGVDSTPTAAANAILCRALMPEPITAEQVQRNLIRPYKGNSGSLTVGEHRKLTMEVEIAGAGTAGTAPAWGLLLEACGFAETITPGTDVVYDLVSEGEPTLTLYCYLDKTKFIITNAKGTVSFELNAKGIPVMKFEFIGTYIAATEEVAMPTGVDYTKFKQPKTVGKTNTPVFSFHGLAAKASAFSINLANALAWRELIGYAGPTSPDRQPTGSVTMEMPSVAVKDWAEVVREGTTGACALTHGTVAGNIVQFAMPATQCKPFSLQDDQSNAMINMPFDINPVDGDDELSITVK